MTRNREIKKTKLILFCTENINNTYRLESWLVVVEHKKVTMVRGAEVRVGELAVGTVVRRRPNPLLSGTPQGWMPHYPHLQDSEFPKFMQSTLIYQVILAKLIFLTFHKVVYLHDTKHVSVTSWYHFAMYTFRFLSIQLKNIFHSLIWYNICFDYMFIITISIFIHTWRDNCNRFFHMPVNWRTKYLYYNNEMHIFWCVNQISSIPCNKNLSKWNF